MEGASPSTKVKASRVKARSRRRPFHPRMSWMQRRRRSHVGAKLASCSSSDGSPERPVKVVVVDGDVGSNGHGSRVCVPVFGGGDQIHRSSGKIGESGPSSASVLKMGVEPGKLEVCDGGRSKEAVKLVAGGSGGSPEHVVNMEAGLYAPDSQEDSQTLKQI